MTFLTQTLFTYLMLYFIWRQKKRYQSQKYVFCRISFSNCDDLFDCLYLSTFSRQIRMD